MTTETAKTGLTLPYVAKAALAMLDSLTTEGFQAGADKPIRELLRDALAAPTPVEPTQDVTQGLAKALKALADCYYQWPDGTSDKAWTEARAALAAYEAVKAPSGGNTVTKSEFYEAVEGCTMKEGQDCDIGNSRDVYFDATGREIGFVSYHDDDEDWTYHLWSAGI